MPYKFPDDIPRPARNWTDEEQKKCIKAANAVLRDEGTEQDAIFACIRAAGKTEHPGGKKSEDLDKQLQIIHGIFYDQFHGRESQPAIRDDFWITNVFDDHVIVEESDTAILYKVSYSKNADGAIDFAPRDDWEKVHIEYVAGKAVVKAVGDWMLDVLGCPYGGPHDGKDAQGEFFAADTNWHLDKGYPELPPVAYYHGWDETGMPKGSPEYLGNALKRWVDDAGIWWRVQLDKTSEWAKRIWDAAKEGVARASTGSLHLSRVDDDGHIREWPVAELSLLDMTDDRQPANTYAVAVPAMKAIYQRAGLPLPDDIKAELEAAQEAEKAASAATAGTKAKQNSGETEMDEKQVKAIAAAAATEAASAVLKADQDRRAAEAKATSDKAAQDKTIADDAVKAARAEWEKEAEIKSRRLFSNKGIYVAKYGDTRRYDNLDVGEHALLVAMLESAQFAQPGNRRATDAAIKALALKIESEADKNEGARLANYALKALPIKAEEINRTTLSSYGSQWVGVAYSQDLWEKIRAGAWVLDRLMANGRVVTIPEGYASQYIPYEGADPTWYKVAEAADTTTTESAGNYYRPEVTIRASKVPTARRQITVAKMGCRTLYTGEMTEDSLISWVAQARRQIVESGQEQFDHAIINGDTTTDTVTNINDIIGTPAGTEVFLLVDGFRKLPLVTNTANARSGTTLDDTDYLKTVKMLGGAGKNARDQAAVTLIPDGNVYWKSLEFSTVKTQDVWPNATLVDGVLTRLWGFELKPSWMMHFDEAGVITGAYELKVNSAGKLDIDTNTNNTTGSILAVRWDQWAIAWKRRMTLETSRYPESDTNQIVAMARWGLAYRDTEAASITYNITL